MLSNRVINYVLEIVLGDYRKHIEECICARDSPRRDYRMHKIIA